MTTDNYCALVLNLTEFISNWEIVIKNIYKFERNACPFYKYSVLQCLSFHYLNML